VEYVTTSISSISLQGQIQLAAETDVLLGAFIGPLVPRLDELLLASNPQYHHVRNLAHGYALLEVDRDREIRVSFVQVAGVSTREYIGVVDRTSFRTPAGSSRIEPI
jgi:hypothetical protein